MLMRRPTMGIANDGRISSMLNAPTPPAAISDSPQVFLISCVDCATESFSERFSKIMTGTMK